MHATSGFVRADDPRGLTTQLLAGVSLRRPGPARLRRLLRSDLSGRPSLHSSPARPRWAQLHRRERFGALAARRTGALQHGYLRVRPTATPTSTRARAGVPAGVPAGYFPVRAPTTSRPARISWISPSASPHTGSSRSQLFPSVGCWAIGIRNLISTSSRRTRELSPALEREPSRAQVRLRTRYYLRCLSSRSRLRVIVGPMLRDRSVPGSARCPPHDPERDYSCSRGSSCSSSSGS